MRKGETRLECDHVWWVRTNQVEHVDMAIGIEDEGMAGSLASEWYH